MAVPMLLYKFRRFDDVRDINPECQGYAASVLRDSLIYGASPWDMNDPWEARPAFLVPDCDIKSEHAMPYINSLRKIRLPEWQAAAEDWLREVGWGSATRRMQAELHRSNSLAFIALLVLQYMSFCGATTVTATEAIAGS
jgi:hypothetical protein